MAQSDSGYTGSIPTFYDQFLGPMLFEPYAKVLAARIESLAPLTVLETAAGTGIVTMLLPDILPETASITATDLNAAMLDAATAKTPSPKVKWQICDATRLPFADGSFDCVLCQFGVMFFPSKTDAYREACRVLRPDGTFLFCVWDKIETNPIAHTISDAVASLFPTDPPNFIRRTPYGYNDVEAITNQLRDAGFANITAEVVNLPTLCPSPRDAVVGSCYGSPLRAEIEARDLNALAAATDAAVAALVARFGEGQIETTIQAIIFTALR